MQNGKGDKDRTTNHKAFRNNFDEIDWDGTKNPIKFSDSPKCLNCGSVICVCIDPKSTSKPCDASYLKKINCSWIEQ